LVERREAIHVILCIFENTGLRFSFLPQERRTDAWLTDCRFAFRLVLPPDLTGPVSIIPVGMTRQFIQFHFIDSKSPKTTNLDIRRPSFLIIIDFVIGVAAAFVGTGARIGSLKRIAIVAILAVIVAAGIQNKNVAARSTADGSCFHALDFFQTQASALGKRLVGEFVHHGEWLLLVLVVCFGGWFY